MELFWKMIIFATKFRCFLCVFNMVSCLFLFLIIRSNISYKYINIFFSFSQFLKHSALNNFIITFFLCIILLCRQPFRYYVVKIAEIANKNLIYFYKNLVCTPNMKRYVRWKLLECLILNSYRISGNKLMDVVIL